MYQLNNILNGGLKFYKELKEDENDRYKSWEYCYAIFNKAHNSKNVDEEFLDYLSLHLSFYLASWGMYRGSSFLLQRDYKIHKPVIKVLLEEKYNSLWGINVNEYKKIENQNNLEELARRICDIYNDIRLKVKNKEAKNEVSDTLITKVLMGTMGCVPAYDRYFIAGIKKYDIALGRFNIKSILQLEEFYNSNYNEFEETRKKMNVFEMEYPQMKVIDMCFWQAGFELDTKR